MTCETCGDTGLVQCASCEGEGSDCHYCGRGICDECGGDGEVNCPECVDNPEPRPEKAS